MKLGEHYTDEQIWEHKDSGHYSNYRFVIPEMGKHWKEYGPFKFIKEDDNDWVCVSNEKGSIESSETKIKWATPDAKRSKDHYTKWDSASGGRPSFNPVSETGGTGGGTSNPFE